MYQFLYMPDHIMINKIILLVCSVVNYKMTIAYASIFHIEMEIDCYVGSFSILIICNI